MASLESIKKLKKQLEKAVVEEPKEKVLELMSIIGEQEIDFKLLQETRIGKAVGKLRKHEHKELALASSNLVEKWRKLVPENTKKEPEVKNETNPSKEDIGATDKKRKTEDSVENSSDFKKVKNESPEHDTKPNKGKAIPQSDGKVREQVANTFKEILGAKSEEDLEDPGTIAEQIEEEMYRIHKGTDKMYKVKYRSLSFNLKNNPELRASVKQSMITAAKLCKMTPQEMASENLKKEREKWTQYHLEAAKLRVSNQTSTDMFKCGKCGKRETSYYQMQTRSADEPMTTFHTCTYCGNRWKS